MSFWSTQQKEQAEGFVAFSEKDKQLVKGLLRGMLPLLCDIAIPYEEKLDILYRYSPQSIVYAVEWVLHPETQGGLPMRLGVAIREACENMPNPTEARSLLMEKNKKYAANFDGLKRGCSEVLVCKDFVEIVQSAKRSGFNLRYDVEGFVHKLNAGLRVAGFNAFNC